MKKTIILISAIMIFGCTKSHIKGSLNSPSNQFSGVTIVSVDPQNKKFAKCLQKELKEGSPPVLVRDIKGCAYTPICPAAMNICAKISPPMITKGKQAASCWLHQRKTHDSPSKGKKPQKIFSH